MEPVCKLYDVNTGAVLHSFNTDCRGFSPALSPNGKQLFYLSQDNREAQIDELTTAERVPLRTISPADTGEYGLLGTRFSPTGKQVLAWTNEKVYLWDISDLTSRVKDASGYNN